MSDVGVDAQDTLNATLSIATEIMQLMRLTTIFIDRLPEIQTRTEVYISRIASRVNEAARNPGHPAQCHQSTTTTPRFRRTRAATVRIGLLGTTVTGIAVRLARAVRRWSDATRLTAAAERVEARR